MCSLLVHLSQHSHAPTVPNTFAAEVDAQNTYEQSTMDLKPMSWTHLCHHHLYCIHHECLLSLQVMFLIIICHHPLPIICLLLTICVKKTLKLNSPFFFLYFCPVEPKCNSKCSPTDCGNNNSHTCKYSIVYMPVCVHPCSMIKYSTIYVT